MDKIRQQPTRQEQEQDISIEQGQEEQEQLTPINTTEYLQVLDTRLGLKITLGSSAFGLNYICNWAIKLKNDWTKNSTQIKSKGSNSYLG